MAFTGSERQQHVRGLATVQVVTRYSLSPFRVWLNRGYGLTTGADGKSGCWLLTLECMEFGEEAARGDFLIEFQ